MTGVVRSIVRSIHIRESRTIDDHYTQKERRKQLCQQAETGFG